MSYVKELKKNMWGGYNISTVIKTLNHNLKKYKFIDINDVDKLRNYTKKTRQYCN